MGLTEKVAAERLKAEGLNVFGENKKNGAVKIFLGQFRDVMVMILLGATVISVLLGEVSQCNDDETDNRFNPPVGRFPEIEEDEAPYRLLCNEYPPAAE